MNPMILYVGIAIGLIALLVIVFLVIAPPRPHIPLERRRAPGAVETTALTRMTDQTTAAIDKAIRRRGKAPFSASELEQANIRMQPSGFVLLVVTASIMLALLGLLLGSENGLGVPLMVTLAALAPIGAKVTLAIRTAARRAKFADQLDESLGLLAGGLRAGHSLLRAVDAVSQETESPTSEEFARVVNETRIGRDLGEALDTTAQRMHSDDFQWVAQAIAINREVGGNLSQVLDRVGHTIRERNEIRRQVKALAAEGKMSAWVLILLPIGVFTFLILTQPNYFNGFFDSVWGVAALALALVLLIVGSLWMMAVVKVKF
ncbi:type II secretion system F family protein [Cryobacterium tagatosivorans]|nr:type II secretion system F family protein [Cryobacterium tagatosivorans]